MPLDLSFPVGTLDERVEFRGNLASLQAHPEVASVVRQAFLRGQVPLAVRHEVVRVFLRSEDRIPTDSWLRGLLDRYRHYEQEQVQPPPHPDFQALIQQAIGSTEGRSRLVQTMLNPIRRGMDYQSIGRSLLQIDQLPPGAPTYYQEAGWDGNGSPVPVQEKVVPSWLQPERLGPLMGHWVYNKEQQEYAKIVSHEYLDGKWRIRIRLGIPVETKAFQLSAFEWHDISDFDGWELCAEPVLLKTIWERLLESDII